MDWVPSAPYQIQTGIKSKPTAPARPLGTGNRLDGVWILSVPIHWSHLQTPDTGGGFMGFEGLLSRYDELIRHMVEEGYSEGHVANVRKEMR